MANIKTEGTWDDVYLIERQDKVLGGEEGVINIQARNLANRTEYLKGEVEKIGKDFSKKESPEFTGNPTAPTQTKGDKTKKLATTEFVAVAVGDKTDKTAFNNLRDLLIGIPLPYPLAQVPEGCLAMNGQRFDIKVYPKLGEKYPSGQLPDFRGEFLRGWDNGRGVDAGRGLLSWQYGSLLVQEAHYQVNNSVSPSGNTADNMGWDKTDSSLTNRIKMTTAVADNPTANWFAVPGTFATDAQIPYVGMARPRNIAFNYICIAA